MAEAVPAGLNGWDVGLAFSSSNLIYSFFIHAVHLGRRGFPCCMRLHINESQFFHQFSFYKLTPFPAKILPHWREGDTKRRCAYGKR